MGKKKNVVVKGNTLKIQGETFALEPEHVQVLRELSRGAHIADRHSDEAMLAIDTSKEVQAYAAELGVELDPEVMSFLATSDLDFEPRENIDLSQCLMSIDDPESDAFLDFLDIFANGKRSEREQLAAFIAESTYSYPQLAKMAVKAVASLGELDGAELVYALSENAPELMEAMLKEAKVS